MERKGKNYYRAELQRSKLSAYGALKDVLRKYGRKIVRITLKAR